MSAKLYILSLRRSHGSPPIPYHTHRSQGQVLPKFWSGWDTNIDASPQSFCVLCAIVYMVWWYMLNNCILHPSMRHILSNWDTVSAWIFFGTRARNPKLCDGSTLLFPTPWMPSTSCSRCPASWSPPMKCYYFSYFTKWMTTGLNLH